MADSIIYGMAIGVRDVPVKGMQVRLDAGAPYGGLMLEPREAAALGAELIARAEEAIHASRASRRPVQEQADGPTPCHNPAPSWLAPYRCSRPVGHTDRHGYAGCFW